MSETFNADKGTAHQGQADGFFVVGGRLRGVTVDGESDLVRDHLASMLQVHNLVVLLGSGASAHLGSPQIRDLSNDQILELMNEAQVGADEDFRSILVSINPSDRGDLEQLLNTLQVASSFMQRSNVTSVDLGNGRISQSAVLRLQRALNAALAQSCRLPRPNTNEPDPLASHRTFLSRLTRVRRENLPRPRLFTTNYDLVIEKALDDLGYPYIDGFSGTVDRRLNLAFYGLDFHRIDSTTQSVVSRSNNSFFLHKVHGSLNWRPAGSSGSGGIESVGVTQVSESESLSDGAVLIYPTAAKEGDTLAYPYADMLRMLSTALQQPDTALLVVGYGFWDAHINRIVLGALAMNPGLNLMVVDPMAVVGSDADLSSIQGRDRTNLPLLELDLDLKTTPIAALAAVRDSRVSVLSGPAATFQNVALLLPDPSVQGEGASPGVLAELLTRLGAEVHGSTNQAQADAK